MTSDAANVPTALHPAPYRDRVSLWALMFGLAGAPIAWSGQTIVNYAFSSHSCYPGSTPRTVVMEGHHWMVWVRFAVTIAAIVIALAAMFIAFRSWSRTRHEHESGHEELLEVGEGRSRFMAYCGLLTSVGFLVAILFAALSFWVPLCAR